MRFNPPLQTKLLLTFLLLLITSWIPNTLNANEGSWTRIDYEYRGFLESLPSHSQWYYNNTRGSGDLWTINLTISGTGFNPTTLLVCNDTAYQSYLTNQTTTGCLILDEVDWSLNTQAAFPHTSTWHLVLDNTGQVSLRFSLTITLYR
ncbi:MAG: hypothetical protein ACFFDP_00900 [Promethearchaeota archaeon]